MQNIRRTDPKVQVFLEELFQVMHKHGLALSHEDNHGSFEIVPITEMDPDWLLSAIDTRSDSSTQQYYTENKCPSCGFVVQGECYSPVCKNCPESVQAAHRVREEICERESQRMTQERAARYAAAMALPCGEFEFKSALSVRCPRCKRKATPGELAPQPDPYAAELYGDRSNVVQCDDCRHRSAENI